MERKFSISDGVVLEAEQCASPNFNQRPDDCMVSLLVIHNISLPPGEFGGGYVERFFQNQLPVQEHPYFAEIVHLEVSAHLFVRRDGSVVQFVNLHDRAWHAGVSCFEGAEGCNDFSIGIELEGADEEPYADAQYETLRALSLEIMRYYPAITPERIVGHCDIAPGRKTDPGLAFDWAAYRNSIYSRE